MGDFIDEVAERALVALRNGDADKAVSALLPAIERNPERLDLRHALAVCQLRTGDANGALETLAAAEAIAYELKDETAAMMMPQIALARAAAGEEALRPEVAEAAYRELLVHEEGNPRARQGLGHLLIAWGRLSEGLAELETYLEHEADEPQYLEATRHFVDALKKLRADEVHPRMFLEAHRGSYVEFFDHHATKLLQEGWVAEAARMHRDEDGEIVNTIPEGARPYAAVRVDLVNMETYQPALVGDQPMVVALAGYEPVARAPALISWPLNDAACPVWVSSQVPWNHLPLTVRFLDPEVDAVALLEPFLEDWYRAGFDGAYGNKDRGRFHEVTDITSPQAGVAQVHVDCGLAEDRAIPDLITRLERLHEQEPIASVLLGRGFVPLGADPEGTVNEASWD